MKARFLVAAAALSLLAAGCGVSENTASGPAAANPNGCTGKSDATATAPTGLTLALVPSGDANKLVQSVKPLEAALTQRLGIPVKGVITQDYQAAVEAIGADQAQIGFLPSLQMIQACTRYGADSVLQTQRNKKISYAAQFFTNNPSKYCADTPTPDAKGNLFCNGTTAGNGPAGLDELPKIKGSTMALLQAASPAGYIFPAAALKKAGVDVTKDVKPVQVTANDASVLAVYRGDAEVGVSYWDARTVVQKDTPDVGKKVVTFALTDEIPNDGVSLSGKLSPEWQQKITTALTDYAGTPDGVAALTAIYQITGLAPADLAALQRTQEAAASIGLG
ncbi:MULTISPECIES: phosphate/phosphite/phosphonate ABC transporter substrate-binding protein [unclassified Pseudonocardia]|jgi:phosphonate transport system substrate-binding protein|uniref:phosphate/phosphite/phosphonate ABC transporter substrate-binding protein n=1 Tax=unclassified Pseudonocardia TaxID=2619320 RepID=UPI000961AD8A|nr:MULTISPECIES: phosphate/phosphite/phosphonate ABC transporter substrate-binding protein [unclassified Pseudonocardia]MBN9097326.1 phosphate/phosphite/phosphonate ABC transporter substrate-binding protein [Pseudonocardia sp.]OJY48883.1 MAG: phosphate ABC transporter substrate-binding protein [Pseudonocardia sp. 73-21]